MKDSGRQIVRAYSCSSLVPCCGKQKGDLMNKLYPWTMRYASQILFVLAAVIFFAGIGQAFVELGNGAGDVTVDGAPAGQRAFGLLMAIPGVLRAGTSTVLPLVAAAALERWDRQAKGRGVPK